MQKFAKEKPAEAATLMKVPAERIEPLLPPSAEEQRKVRKETSEQAQGQVRSAAIANLAEKAGETGIAALARENPLDNDTATQLREMIKEKKGWSDQEADIQLTQALAGSLKLNNPELASKLRKPEQITQLLKIDEALGVRQYVTANQLPFTGVTTWQDLTNAVNARKPQETEEWWKKEIYPKLAENDPKRKIGPDAPASVIIPTFTTELQEQVINYRMNADLIQQMKAAGFKLGMVKEETAIRQEQGKKEFWWGELAKARKDQDTYSKEMTELQRRIPPPENKDAEIRRLQEAIKKTRLMEKKSLDMLTKMKEDLTGIEEEETPKVNTTPLANEAPVAYGKRLQAMVRAGQLEDSVGRKLYEDYIAQRKKRK